MAYTDIKYKLKSVGKNVVIGDNVYIRYPHLVEIGDNVIIDEFVYITAGLKLGSYIHISPHVSIIGGVEAKLIMDDFTCLTSGVRIVCTSDNFSGSDLTNSTVPPQYRPNTQRTTVHIKKHCAIGTNSVVMPDVTIGEGTVIGAMSLVTKDLAPYGIYYGNPVKRIRERDEQSLLEMEQRMINDLIKYDQCPLIKPKKILSMDFKCVKNKCVYWDGQCTIKKEGL